ncbi:ribonuclease P protein component [Flavobacterium psychrotrophum]|uniref:ribonuclease P protein component n=1 Tax=Flavobacterium psychrotrophum TaxID=2294119 RepID=UPI000E31CAEF|nr:ribonuclease P protein component [Flavobacterium psychrotrophum]
METKRFTYPRAEKLKSRNLIGDLFTQGKSVSKYPLRLVYMPLETLESVPLQMGVSVSKKYFKRAHDRNYFKRLLREAYRHNKHLLSDAIDKPYAIMFFYQTKDRLPHTEVMAKTTQLFEKFLVQEGFANQE